MDSSQGPDALRQTIAAAVKSVDRGDGVLILTDMFGGTPSNISLSFLEDGRVEILTGVNLPMLIKAVQLRSASTLSEAAKAIGEYGRGSIQVAGEILGGNN